MMKKRTLISVLMMSLIISAIISMPVSAETQDPALLKSAVKYDIDQETGKWQKAEKTTFKYKNAYPVKISTYVYAQDETLTKNFKYTFKNKKPVQMTQTSSYVEDIVTNVYNKNGQIDKTESSVPGRNGGSSSTYVYGKTNYFTSVLHDTIIYNDAIDQPKYSYREESDTVDVTLQKGLLKKTVNRGIYANWDDPEKKSWERFNGTYTIKYDSSGIANVASAKFRVGPNSGKQTKFKITRENGLITKVIRYRWNGDEKKWENENKFIFKYTGTKISPVRYAAMINAQILGPQSNYYIFNWY